MHRLVEIHYLIGLEKESKKYAQLLGYNYKSSKWYEKTYSVFNETYKNNKLKQKKNKNSLIKKARSLFD